MNKRGLIVCLFLLVFGVSLSLPAYSQDTEEIPEVREYDYIILKGMSKPIVGLVVRQTDEYYYVKLRDYASETEMPIKKDQVVEIKWHMTPEDALNLRIKKAQATPEAYLSVIKWALGFPELFERTKGLLVKVVKMRPQSVEPYLMLLNFIEQDCAEKGRTMTESERDIILDALEASLPFKHPVLTARYAAMLVELGLGRQSFALLKEFYDSLPENTIASHRRIVELTLAEVALSMEKYESAKQVLDKLLEREPDCYRALLLSAKVALESGRLDDATTILEKLKTIEPPYWEVYSLIGAVEYAKGNLQAAEEAYTTASRLCKPNDGLIFDMSQVLILQGKVYTAKKLLERAKDKSGWRYNCLRALAAKIAGEGDDAVDSWLKNGAEAADAPAFAHYQYAAFLLGRAKLDDAMKWAKKALEGGYDSADGFRLIARIYCAKGDIKTAERYLLYSLSSSPQDANTLCMLAEVAVMKRRYSDALKYLTDGLAANPEHLDSLKSCAYIYYLLNRFADARGYLDKASAIAPNDPYVLRLNKALSEIQNLLCWRDLFRRADSIDVANGWSEEGEQLGVEIKIKDGNLVMEGTQKDNGDVLLTRAENLKGFVRLEAMLDFTGALETNCGLKILVRDAKGNLQSWINFIKDANGKLRYNYSSTGALDGELKDAPDLGVCPNKAKLGIELADQKSSLWRFYLDGEFVGEVKAEGVLKRAGSGANIFVGVYGRAAPVKQWSLSCDYVYVFRRKSGE